MVSVRVCLSGVATPDAGGQRRRRQVHPNPEWTLHVRQSLLQRLHDLLMIANSGYWVDRAIELLVQPLSEQHGVEIRSIGFADIYAPTEDGEYTLTPEGVRGPVF